MGPKNVVPEMAGGPTRVIQVMWMGCRRAVCGQLEHTHMFEVFSGVTAEHPSAWWGYLQRLSLQVAFACKHSIKISYQSGKTHILAIRFLLFGSVCCRGPGVSCKDMVFQLSVSDVTLPVCAGAMAASVKAETYWQSQDLGVKR
jgi:hypothetical protein